MDDKKNKKRKIKNDEILTLNKKKTQIQENSFPDNEEKKSLILDIEIKKKKSKKTKNENELSNMKENDDKKNKEKENDDSKLVSSSSFSSSSSSISISTYGKVHNYPSIRKVPIINIKNFYKAKTIKKIKKKSRYLNIIRKFHNIYEHLSGKNFIVEKQYQHQTNLEYYRKLINIKILICVIAFLSIFTGILYYEKTFVGNKEKATISDTVILYFLNIQSVLLFIAIILKEKIKLKKDIDLKIENEGATLTNTNRYIIIILYFVFFILQPSHIFQNIKIKETNDDDGTIIYYSLNSIFLVFLLLRTYFIFVTLLHISIFMTVKSQYICRQYSCKNSLLYCLKCFAQYKPIQLYISGFLIILFTMAYGVRIFERPANDIFDSYIDAVWLILITMTTVGYGDITAKTLGGRIISVFSCLSGVFLTSMIIVTITNFLSLELHEKRMLDILEKTENLEEKKNLAKEIIQMYVEIITKNYNGYNYNKIMNDFQLLSPLKNKILELKSNEGYISTNFSKEFVSLHNRIGFFIKFQEKIFKKRENIYNNIRKLENRIKKMSNKNLI